MRQRVKLTAAEGMTTGFLDRLLGRGPIGLPVSATVPSEPRLIGSLDPPSHADEGQGLPRLEIDGAKLAQNAQKIVSMCAEVGAQVIGVTKACCGMPEVALAMLDGGVIGLGDSRLDNIRQMREAGIDCEITLLRAPLPQQADEVVALADVSLQTELATLRAVSEAALRRSPAAAPGSDGSGRRRHKVILMVDVGDLREGVLPRDAANVVEEVLRLEGIELIGLGTNLACFGGVVPDEANMKEIRTVADEIAKRFGLQLLYLSGGNSSALHWIKRGRWFGGIDHLRIGESMLLGWDITDRTPIPGLHRDAFVMYAGVIEVKQKPSVPIGTIGPDAFGHVPKFVDKGTRRRALVALGRADIGAGECFPMGLGIEVVGVTSDHMVLDVTDSPLPVKVGDEVALLLDYGALVGAMSSPHVEKVVV